ncbi:MAG: HNH endonuclease [Ferruginibacter sp.]
MPESVAIIHPIKPIPVLSDSDRNRFLAKIDISQNINECWNWIGRTYANSKKPYGQFDLKSCYMAHRISYFFHYGVDPLKLCVLHKCDNHKCVNPNHLFLGTNADNVADKVLKGRQARNVCWNKGKETIFRLWDNANCSANKKQFVEMKLLYEKNNISVNELSKRYGISKKAVSSGIRKLGGYIPKVYHVLNEKEVLEIRDKYSPKLRNSVKLAKEYDIGNKTIMDIVQFKTWKHI